MWCALKLFKITEYCAYYQNVCLFCVCAQCTHKEPFSVNEKKYMENPVLPSLPVMCLPGFLSYFYYSLVSFFFFFVSILAQTNNAITEKNMKNELVIYYVQSICFICAILGFNVLVRHTTPHCPCLLLLYLVFSVFFLFLFKLHVLCVFCASY